MGQSWESAIKQKGELTIARASNASGWVTAFDTAVIRYNALSSSLALGVTFRDIGPKNLKSATWSLRPQTGRYPSGSAVRTGLQR
jgi:hypothetical protein